MVGLAIAAAAYLLSRGNFWGSVVVLLVWVHGGALMVAENPAFEVWTPSTRAGRLVRRYIQAAYWLREGGGRRWTKAALGFIGAGLIVMVVFGLAWAAYG